MDSTIMAMRHYTTQYNSYRVTHAPLKHVLRMHTISIIQIMRYAEVYITDEN